VDVVTFAKSISLRRNFYQMDLIRSGRNSRSDYEVLIPLFRGGAEARNFLMDGWLPRNLMGVVLRKIVESGGKHG
jgi:hypothetical protein